MRTLLASPKAKAEVAGDLRYVNRSRGNFLDQIHECVCFTKTERYCMIVAVTFNIDRVRGIFSGYSHIRVYLFVKIRLLRQLRCCKYLRQGLFMILVTVVEMNKISVYVVF